MMLIQPTLSPQHNGPVDLNVYVDADWAGCPTTRKLTSGFTMTLMGSTIQVGSCMQAVVALSSAESASYAICTAAQLETLALLQLVKEIMLITNYA